MNLEHVFVDVAMTEAKATADVTAIAVVRTDHRGNVLAAFSEKIGDDARDYATVSNAVHAEIIEPFTNSYVVVAHSAQLDRDVLMRAYRLAKRGQELFKGRAWLDTVQLAWPFAYHDLVASRDLDTICKAFGVTNTAPDTAMGDCEALVRVYWAMMRRLDMALTGEEAVRNVIGEPIAKLRSIIGF